MMATPAPITMVAAKSVNVLGAAPRKPDAMPAIASPATRIATAPKRAISSEPGSAAIPNSTIGSPVRTPTSVPDSCKSAWMSKMTGGTARIVSRRPTPASQSRLTAIQNSRMRAPEQLGRRLLPARDLVDDGAVVEIRLPRPHACLEHVAMHVEHGQSLPMALGLLQHQ